MFKQVREAAIGTKFAPLYTTLFMADLEEKIFNAFEEKPEGVEVHRRHSFYLGTWRRISGKISQ